MCEAKPIFTYMCVKVALLFLAANAKFSEKPNETSAIGQAQAQVCNCLCKCVLCHTYAVCKCCCQWPNGRYDREIQLLGPANKPFPVNLTVKWPYVTHKPAQKVKNC